MSEKDPSAALIILQPVEPYDLAVNEVTRRYVRSNGSETGHWLDSVLSDGEIVKLEDGTIWKIEDTDTVDSSLWLDTEDITVCEGKLINTDDKTSVGTHQIH